MVSCEGKLAMDARADDMLPVSPAPGAPQQATTFAILGAVSLSHFINDMIQSLVPSLYPILKTSFALDYGHIGLITFTFQCTASLLQPVVGLYTDKRALPFSLAVGMGFSLVGLLLLSMAPAYGIILLAAALIGLGSAVFHPESSRIARMASGGRYGMAQSVFQVGGNAGQALGPLLAAFFVVPHGQYSVAYFAIVALIGIIILSYVGRWYKNQLEHMRKKPPLTLAQVEQALSRRRVVMSIGILVALVFSKQFYMASFHTFYAFYLIDKFGLSIGEAQIYLFIFLGAFAVGVLVGGPAGDRIGRKYVIWGSVLGVLPFTLALPHVDLFWTVTLSIIIGFVLASAMSAIIVYAQELMPGRVGLVAGLFFGLAFGMGGLGAALLGQLADMTSIATVYHVCAWLPVIGLITWFLPTMTRSGKSN
jgi:FSR family fosmidomycin resistance protein-like MFS transporter